MVDYVLEYMKQHNIPLTRENYLEINYMGNPPDPMPAELEAEIPDEVKGDSTPREDNQDSTGGQ